VPAFGWAPVKTGKMATKQSEYNHTNVYKLDGFYFASLKIYDASGEAD